MGEILTVADVADLLKVSDRTVRNWIEAGKLKGYRFGQAYRIKKADFEAFIEESEIKTEKGE